MGLPTTDSIGIHPVVFLKYAIPERSSSGLRKLSFRLISRKLLLVETDLEDRGQKRKYSAQLTQ